MSAAKKGDAVVVEYIVRIGGGRVVGGTGEGGPQTLVLGQGQLFSELEEALLGMSAGEEKSVTVPSANAFGPRDEAMVIEIPRERLQQGVAPEPGMQLSARAQDGQEVTLTITEVKEENVIADANHPLAGEDLHFSVTLVEVKAA